MSKKISHIIIYIFICISVSVFAQKKEKPVKVSDDSLKITLEHNGYAPGLPTYKIKIYEKGFTVYEGIRNVEKNGTFRILLSEEEINSIVDYAYKYQFFDMNDVYTQSLTPDESASTSIKVKKDYIKKVTRKGTQPKSLLLLEAVIDDLLKSKTFYDLKLKEPKKK